jgi:formiminoglutamase
MWLYRSLPHHHIKADAGRSAAGSNTKARAVTIGHHPWLELVRGDAPLILSVPHTGVDLDGLEPRFASPWLARKDTDWWVHDLYDFAPALGATVVLTRISRAVIDVNRDLGGRPLYPGLPATELCPTTTFDGEPLYEEGQEPDDAEIAERRRMYFDPYHATLRDEVARLRDRFAHVVMYDCHAIRSTIPRLFANSLPNFNVGSNDGKSADTALTAAIEAACARSAFSRVLNGRFKGGFITRSIGNPSMGGHAVQMELSFRGFLREPFGAIDESLWPTPYDPVYAAPMRAALGRVIEACLTFAAHFDRGAT